MLFGGIEAGGTKFICAIGDENGKILERIQIPTTVPKETVGQVIQFFKRFDVIAMGVGSFGPIDINQDSPTYGSITSTPKTAWKDYPLLNSLKDALDVPFGFNTDVNAAALAEATFGAATGLDSCLYITVGTGIGAGAVVQGKLLQGFTHPEMGHILVRRHSEDSYEGTCPYHKDCLEGLAAGPSLSKRWGKEGVELENKQEVWEMEGYYLAQALMQYTLILAPKKIILGGGVMKQKQVFSFIYDHLKRLINDYVSFPYGTEELDQYIVAPGLKDNAGIIGALLLGKQAYQEEMKKQEL